MVAEPRYRIVGVGIGCEARIRLERRGRPLPYVAEKMREAVSGGVPERKAWIEGSGHFRVGDLARMTPEERQKMANDMLTEGH